MLILFACSETAPERRVFQIEVSLADNTNYDSAYAEIKTHDWNAKRALAFVDGLAQTEFSELPEYNTVDVEIRLFRNITQPGWSNHAGVEIQSYELQNVPVHITCMVPRVTEQPDLWRIHHRFFDPNFPKIWFTIRKDECEPFVEFSFPSNLEVPLVYTSFDECYYRPDDTLEECRGGEWFDFNAAATSVTVPYVPALDYCGLEGYKYESYGFLFFSDGAQEQVVLIYGGIY